MNNYCGLLWFDNDPKAPLETKIGRAVEYYLDKYGTPPTLCFVHPSQAQDVTSAAGVEVRGNKHVRPNHFWIGVNNQEALPMK